MGQTTTKSIPILKSLTSVKTIKSPHFSSFETILPLHDTRLASSTENTILIYNPTSNYSLDLTIECPFIITSLVQLPNSHLVACGKEKSITIYSLTDTTSTCEFTIDSAHTDEISKVILLPSTRFATSSKDGSIKIWSSTTPYNPTPLKEIMVHKNVGLNSILYMPEKDLLIAGDIDTLRLYNATTYEKIAVINDVLCQGSSTLIQIDERRVLTGGAASIDVVDVEKRTKESAIDIEVGWISCFMLLRDNNTVLCGCDKGMAVVYEVDTRKTRLVQWKDKGETTVSNVIKIDESRFITCEYEAIVWNY